MKRAFCVLAGCAIALAASAATPEPKDFARGLYLRAPEELPAFELELPDAVYDGVVRADLGDLRVFNRAGIVVPHALCTAPAMLPGGVHDEPLAVFPLVAAAAPAPGPGTRVQVQTPGGTTVNVQEAPSMAIGQSQTAIIAPRATVSAPDHPAAAHVMDASWLHDPVRALRFAWTTADGAAELAVRIEASDDLNTWRTVVPNTTLLRTTANGQVLERVRVEVPLASYHYLRVERASGGPPPRIDAVTAETEADAREPEPFRFAALPQPAGSVADGFTFDSGRLAPVQLADIQLPASNMSVTMALDSRRAAEQSWQQRWSGTVSSVQNGGTIARFAPTADPQWRLRVLRGGETLGTARPTLALGYHRARLQFLSQGGGPYLLAFGSARVAPADAAACDSLLGPLSAEERAQDMGRAEAQPAPAELFGGDAAYTVPPPPTPVRQIVLWAVLVAGTAVLALMAYTLMRRLRAPGAG